MDQKEIETMQRRQQAYFASGATKPYKARMEALTRLEKAIRSNEKQLCGALAQDLGKSEMESIMCEIGLVLDEIRWMKKHLKALCQNKEVPTPVAQMVARSYQSPSPYGNVLIMSPWNYPVLLTLDPLVDALAAGNTAILKPSAYAPETMQAVRDLIGKCFNPEYVGVVTGGREENQFLLELKFDKIFFTGSTTVGKLVMKSAAEHLTPVTLELGGKSPCIVEKSANIALAAKRIVFGKLTNCGQTCVAPDYILCDEAVHDALIDALKTEMKAQFGEKPLENPLYGNIINEKHFQRILGLIDPGKVVYGGGSSKETRKIEPTILDHVTWEDAVMQEEIFGPVLPVLTFRELTEAIRAVENRPRPLALYLFTENAQIKKTVLDGCRFGGGCINDTLIHLATSQMPFGGVGESGMGGYHGKAGFDEFTHYRSIVDKMTWMDMDIRYQPYTEGKLETIRKVMM